MPTKVHLVKPMVFPVVIYGCESWTIKKAEHGRIDTFFFLCPNQYNIVSSLQLNKFKLKKKTKKNRFFWTVVLEKTLASPLDCKEVQPTYPKGDQSWVFIGGTDAKAETPKLWWEELEKGTTEDEMVGWHHRLDGHGFGWTLGVGDGQGGLACWNSWGRKESDTTEQLNWTEAPFAHGDDWLDNSPFMAFFLCLPLSHSLPVLSIPHK